MNRYRLYQLGFIVLGVILGCSQAEELLLGIPRVATGKDIFTNQAGAIFQADVLSMGTQGITDHGFQWREFGTTQIDFTGIGTLTSNKFELEVNQGFEENKQYEVRAFISAADFTAYGEWVKFSGAGSMAPLITGFSPAQATWGDTISISGDYFSNNSSIVKVEFGTTVAEIISSTDQSIKVKVPNDLISSSTVGIRVKVGSKFGNSSQTFSLLGTQVLQVTPNKGGSGTVVVIKGKYFNPTHSSVKFGDVIVPIAQAYKDSLKLILPKEVSGGEKDVTVNSGPFQSTLTKAFTRNFPQLQEVIALSGFYGDTVILRGINFGADFSDNMVVVNEAYANIIGIKDNELTIIIPTVPTPEVKFSITADYVTHQSDLIYKINKPKISNILPDEPIYPGQRITVKGENFYPSIYHYPYSYRVDINNQNVNVVSASQTELKAEFPLLTVNTATVDVIRFDTSKVSSTKQIVTPIKWTYTMPGDQRAKSVSFTIGMKTYVLTGLSMSTILDNDVYEFDASTKNWKTVSSFPGEPRYGATAFVVNNKGYVMGGYGITNSPLNDLWEYNPSTDTWTRKKDYLFHPLEAFNLNGSIYCLSNITYIIIPPSDVVTGFGYNTGFWKYNPSTDSWTTSATPSYQLNRNSNADYFTMQIGGTLTIGYLNYNDGNYFYQQYNALNNTWMDRGFVNINGNSPVTFDYAGNGYLLVSNALHKYNPNLNQWSKLEENLSYMLWQGGDPIKFRVNDTWYFSLFNYNQYSIQPHISYKNMMLEFNCQLSGF